MKSLAVTEARRDFADLINEVAYREERVSLTRQGKVVAGIVSPEDMELLETYIDAIDVAEALEALEAEENVESEPREWREIKKDLGL